MHVNVWVNLNMGDFRYNGDLFPGPSTEKSIPLFRNVSKSVARSALIQLEQAAVAAQVEIESAE